MGINRTCQLEGLDLKFVKTIPIYPKKFQSFNLFKNYLKSFRTPGVHFLKYKAQHKKDKVTPYEIIAQTLSLTHSQKQLFLKMSVQQLLIKK